MSSFSDLKRQLRNKALGLPPGETINAHEAVAVKAAEKQKGPEDWTPPEDVYATPKDLEAGTPALLASLTRPAKEIDYYTKASLDNLWQFFYDNGTMLARAKQQA